MNLTFMAQASFFQAAGDKHSGKHAPHGHNQTSGQKEAIKWPAGKKRKKLIADEQKPTANHPN